eukprot:CAMPEP_0115030744 /NCGR_PEP_ID=MMETSP0216-20121206/38037_1 /TAXON_ID=223996 /ORGANISM="Protocruzia adherens, Strain Boccale" /LENGTH=255 /DNA_ID=CAMNT_0002408095 /DNA_START=75 /DNA_END=842 /DNA_ORIENTATION=+
MLAYFRNIPTQKKVNLLGYFSGAGLVYFLCMNEGGMALHSGRNFATEKRRMEILDSTPATHTASKNILDEATLQEGQPVKLNGEFAFKKSVHVHAKCRSRNGVVTITPFKLEGTDEYVLVNRGWSPQEIGTNIHDTENYTPFHQVIVDGVVLNNPTFNPKWQTWCGITNQSAYHDEKGIFYGIDLDAIADQFADIAPPEKLKKFMIYETNLLSNNDHRDLQFENPNGSLFPLRYSKAGVYHAMYAGEKHWLTGNF